MRFGPARRLPTMTPWVPEGPSSSRKARSPAAGPRAALREAATVRQAWSQRQHFARQFVGPTGQCRPHTPVLFSGDQPAAKMLCETPRARPVELERAFHNSLAKDNGNDYDPDSLNFWSITSIKTHCSAASRFHRPIPSSETKDSTVVPQREAEVPESCCIAARQKFINRT
jgi:hypothetical protein